MYNFESVSTTICNYNGQFAAFVDDKTAEKYYPELKKLFEILSSLKDGVLKTMPVYFSSQNFGCKD